MPQELKTLEEFTKLKSETKDKLIVVDFWASWCGPCINIAPWFKEQSEIYKDVIFAKVDVDNNSETSEQEGISCMPTFKVYYNDQLLNTIEGASKAELEKMFKLDNQGIIKFQEDQKLKEEKKKILEKLCPSLKNIDEYKAVQQQKNLTGVQFFYDGYSEECDKFHDQIMDWVKEKNENKDENELKVYKVDLAETGVLGNQAKVMGLPWFICHYDNKMVETFKKSDSETLEKVKSLFSESTSAEFSQKMEKMILEREEKEAKMNKCVPQFDEKEDYEIFLKNEELLVIDYYATWCGPCINFAPTFKEMAFNAQENGKAVKFCKIDCDKNSHAKKHGDVKCYPTFKLYKNGKEVGKLEGASKVELEKLIDANI